MASRTRTLLALLLAAVPCGAAGPPFTTELSLGFGAEGSSTGRPLVVLGGTPTDAYDYSADGTAQTVDVAATRWLGPIGDDGRTPLELLPYLARASSVTARVALTGASRSSFGSFTGKESSLEVRLAGDGTLRESGLSAVWLVAKAVAVHGGLRYGSERETAASTSVERPSGRADVSTSGTRFSGATGSLGVALRLGEHEVSATGSYGETDLTREDASAFTGSSQPAFSTLSSAGIERRAALAARLLLLGRRLAVDAGGDYSLTTSSTDLEDPVSRPFSQGRAITRELALVATWFAARGLGLSAGFSYGTRDVSSGSPERLRASRSETGRALSVGARWFASERVQVTLSASRRETVSIVPPGSQTFQRFEDVVDRATLGASLRF